MLSEALSEDREVVKLESLKSAKVWGDEVIKVGEVAFTPAGSDDPAIGRVVAILEDYSNSMFGPTIVLCGVQGEGGKPFYITTRANKCERGRN